MDHHIIEDTAGNRNIGCRGRLRITRGNDDNMGIADGAILNSVRNRLVVVVKAAVETNLELDTLLLNFRKEVLDLGYIIINGLLAEYMLASLYRSQRNVTVGIGGRADKYSVNIRVVDDIHKVGGNIGDLAVSQPLACAGLVKHRIRGSDHFYAGNTVDEVVNVQLADAAATNDANS